MVPWSGGICCSSFSFFYFVRRGAHTFLPGLGTPAVTTTVLPAARRRTG